MSFISIEKARPVTALDAWTDFELRHEFDSPILTNSDYFTKANTGEVAPGATSPLTVSTTIRILDLNFQTIVKKQQLCYLKKYVSLAKMLF